MTKLYDINEIIKSIQTFLLSIDRNKYRVVPSGSYDDKTRDAIKDFQGNKGLNQNGVVDEETLNLLYLDYLSEELDKSVRRKASQIQFPILPGSFSGGMIEIHRAMSELLDYYGFSHNLFDGNYFNEETKKALKILQEIYLLENKVEIDEKMYYRIFNDLNSVRKMKNNTNI